MVAEMVFVELSILLAVALVISSIVRLLKQPLVIGYILAGIIVSPYFLDLVQSTESIGTFAEMGVAVLLFMVGLNLNPKVIKDVGKVALLTGFGQILFSFATGFGVAKLFGFETVQSIFIGVALSFSSTIIIIKLLSDKSETCSLYGKIAIGVLIVQDLVAILAIVVISSVSGGGDLSSMMLEKFLIGTGFVVALFLLGTYLLPHITKAMAKSQELLLLFSIGWALAMASLFYYLGFSMEIGALLAGVSLSTSPYRYEIGSKMKPLRDFFLLLFFILLGSQIQFSSVTQYIGPIIAFSALVLIGKPLIIFAIMGGAGYTKRNTFLTGVTLSQMSEFSFILMALGMNVMPQYITNEIFAMVTITGLITIAGSTYMMMHMKGMYSRFSGFLRIFERRGKKKDEGRYHRHEDYEILLFGYNRIGYSLEKSFKKLKKKFLIVDNNPDTIVDLATSRIDCRYGDAEDSELLDELPIEKCKMIISTIPDKDTNILLINKVKSKNPKAVIVVVSHQIEESLGLYEAGATYVVTPHFLGGTHTANLIEKYGLSKSDFEKEGAKNTNELLRRQMRGHKDVLHERDR